MNILGFRVVVYSKAVWNIRPVNSQSNKNSFSLHNTSIDFKKKTLNLVKGNLLPVNILLSCNWKVTVIVFFIDLFANLVKKLKGIDF